MEHIEYTPREIAQQKKWWAIGNNILEKMRKANEWQWSVKRKPKPIISNPNQSSMF